jgi:flagellar biogenesis protein FliO
VQRFPGPSRGCPVDPRCIVHLVRAGERRLLLGTDLNGVKALTELPSRLPAPEAAIEPPAVNEEKSVPAAGIVLGPTRVEVPAPPPAQDEILALIAKLRERTQPAAAAKD